MRRKPLFSFLFSLEHPLLTGATMHRIHVRAAFAALALVSGVLAAPVTVGAQAITPMFTPFGTHGANSNLQTQPLGAADCDVSIPFTFNPATISPTMRYIDVWWSSSATATCQSAMTRATTTNLTCMHLGQFMFVSSNMTAMPTGITPSLLFGGCTSGTRTFFFFDTASAPDNSTTFTSWWQITATLSATAPVAPLIAGTPAGDQVIQINWNASSFTSLGVGGQVFVYAAPGCTGSSSPDGNGTDAGTTTMTSTLMGGGTAPTMHVAASSAASPITVNTSNAFGWTTGTYGEMVTVAIATVDSASNVSPLSNTVCVQHVQVSGFWEQYCAEHGMPDVAQCTANYHGCSVGAPGPRTDFAALAFGLGVLGVLGVRRRRSR